MKHNYQTVCNECDLILNGTISTKQAENGFLFVCPCGAVNEEVTE